MTPILRDGNGIAHIVGVSGGKDSVCLALALQEKEPRPYTYVCTPTGDELPEMVKHWHRVEELLGAPLIKLTNGTLAGHIARKRMLPSFRYRWCTELLKLIPFGQLTAAAAPAIAYIGLRADEDEREGTRPGGDSAVIGNARSFDYPFQRWDWGLEEVLAYLNERGVSIPERTDCARCPYQKLGEWYNLWLYHPEIYASAEADEEKYQHTYRSTQRDSWPAALKDLRTRFEAGVIPERSLRMMETRKGMCRACSL